MHTKPFIFSVNVTYLIFCSTYLIFVLVKWAKDVNLKSWFFVFKNISNFANANRYLTSPIPAPQLQAARWPPQALCGEGPVFTQGGAHVTTPCAWWPWPSPTGCPERRAGRRDSAPRLADLLGSPMPIDLSVSVLKCCVSTQRLSSKGCVILFIK